MRTRSERLAVLFAATLLVQCGGGGTSALAPPPPPPPVAGKIKHVVVIFQENRTPDNLFHGLPGADIANQGVDSTGQTITLTPGSLVTNYDLGHSHPDFVAMYDGGRMDGADKVHINCTGAVGVCPGPNPAFHYVDPAEVVPYFQLAERFTFGDRMFQSNQGPSFPAHQFIISGTSIPSVGGQYGNYFVSENPLPALTPTGCAEGPPGDSVMLIDPQGVESVSIFPCFEHPTLIDLLDAAGHSWRYYAPSSGSIWTAPNAIHHLRMGSDWSHVIIPQSQVLADLAAGSLADVTWVIPDGAQSDHARSTDGTGPAWVASVVNAIGNSAYWADTAIFITWDDWGGWYDHVAPPIHSVYESGFRVPLIVVSPYAKKGYVSHVTHDFGSILKFIESTFALPSLGYDDARSDDLSDCFDYTQSVAPYQPVAAAYDAAYFLQRTRTSAPKDPDDD